MNLIHILFNTHWFILQKLITRNKIINWVMSKGRNRTMLKRSNSCSAFRNNKWADTTVARRHGRFVCQIGTKWKKNPGLFRSDFSTFWLVEPNCTEIWSEKANLPHFGPKSDTPDETKCWLMNSRKLDLISGVISGTNWEIQPKKYVLNLKLPYAH